MPKCSVFPFRIRALQQVATENGNRFYNRPRTEILGFWNKRTDKGKGTGRGDDRGKA